MGTVGNPQSWVPYQNIKDCSQGFCSLYCPQWCYINFPPPPYEFPDEDSGTNFSPLVIAIIGILASAFLLVSYYTVISKYCGNLDSRRRTASNESNENQNNQLNHEPWQASTMGLDEALINTITVCKYSKKDGLIDETDCSVCLSEFQDDESLRLLPKCSHAFHLTCIDTWLKSHSSCPLCRANIVSVPCPLQIQLPALHPPVEVQDDVEDNNDSSECEHENHIGIAMQEMERRRNTTSSEDVSSSSHTIVEIRDEGNQYIRRSVSMDSTCCHHVSIADVLGMNQDEDSDEMEEEDHGRVELSNKRHLGGERKSDIDRRRALHCVTSPIAMKRSISSGRFLFSSARHGRGRNVILPM